MSHQTGITANEDLLKAFATSKNGKLRLIKISIENEQLVCACVREVEKDWKQDYDISIRPLLEESVPSYIMYRLDETFSLGYSWLLLSWIPDSASIRQKMVYASTKATLKTEFGSAYIMEEVHATSLDETTLEGYYKTKKASSAPVPLTAREEELKELRRSEINTEISTNTKQQTMSGISLPITEETTNSIRKLVEGLYNYLQLEIDLKEEKIKLVKAANIETNQLADNIPKIHARYHVYLFKHTHNGDYQKSFVFMYSMPGYTCSVKERMIYASCKAPFLQTLESMGVSISKKLEIDNGSDLTKKFLLEELYPKKAFQKPQFAKPKGPPNRGAKRFTKTQAEEFHQLN